MPETRVPKYSPGAQQVLDAAEVYQHEMGDESFGTLHILVGLISVDHLRRARLIPLGISKHQINKRRGQDWYTQSDPYADIEADEVKAILSDAEQRAATRGRSVWVSDILFALRREKRTCRGTSLLFSKYPIAGLI